MKYNLHIHPMLAKLSDRPFDDEDWLFEIKYDGYRAIAEIEKGKVRLYSRNGLDFSNDFPLIYEALSKTKLHVILDGELVALDKKGKPSYRLIQKVKDDPRIPLVYYVFDLLHWNGKNLKNTGLLERKKMLKAVIHKQDHIQYSDHELKNGKKFFHVMQRMNLEGMIAKRKNSFYLEGKRNGDWLKIKNVREQEAILVGFTEPKGSRKYLGSVLLAVYRKNKLSYVGRAGSGFNEKNLKDLYEAIKPRIRKTSPFEEAIPLNGKVTWIKPELVGNIKFTEWTEDGYMRHPVFLGLRKDKPAIEVVIE